MNIVEEWVINLKTKYIFTCYVVTIRCFLIRYPTCNFLTLNECANCRKTAVFGNNVGIQNN